ncbi:MAG: UPF0254 family protein [Methanobacteriaceae archaeon]|nr:UPF0254 family protein [Methanobacteriaceae archaeon]MDP2837369.1 UPF0254 family protein [Methanobacteriaceae archaeon]MDP3035555.1 UPF0254 family protein [Methanobacteriaceae archaeon]MDP3485772.1 UPF0254 family protein [Methanobacteriaceae archaeon]MDP3624223.1 UPF0254 family protein [Methanobacteriaceae archaeon]
MIIKIATAECFTHGKVAQEIHSFSQGYPQNYTWNLNSSDFNLSLVAGMFIPTINGVENVLRFNPSAPLETINDIKIYDQEGDLEMAVLMAKSVQKICKSDIGVGTTAGVGKGGLAVCDNKHILLSTSDVHTDLRKCESSLIFERQKSGIEKVLFMLECLITGQFDAINSKKIIKIDK